MGNNDDKGLIGRFLGRLLPDAPDFYGMLAEQSRAVERTVALLEEFMENGDPAIAKLIMQREHEADEAKNAAIRMINEAFSTPIDREDLARAVANLDKVVNYCKDTVNEMDLLAVKPDRHMLEMARLMHAGAVALQAGYGKLGNKNSADAEQDADLARKSDRNVNKVYRTALAELFQGTDYVQMMKKREIYRHLTNAAERVVHSADTLHDIVVKMA